MGAPFAVCPVPRGTPLGLFSPVKGLPFMEISMALGGGLSGELAPAAGTSLVVTNTCKLENWVETRVLHGRQVPSSTTRSSASPRARRFRFAVMSSILRTIIGPVQAA